MKISKSNFIVMTITMLAILFLFQFSNLSSIYTSRATNNSNTETTKQITANETIEAQDLESSISYTTAIIGDERESEVRIAKEWCIYIKRSYAHYKTLKAFHNDLSQHCKLLIVNSDVINNHSDINILSEVTRIGINIIFTSLPKTSLIKGSEQLKNILGIKRIVNPNYYTDGLTIYEGFLLGGKTTYEDYKIHIPYYELTSGTKTYIVGEMKNKKKNNIQNESLPPIVWRSYYDNSFVFSVNTDFFKDHTGLGMLTSMLSETNEYFIYPIVNAQNIVCQNYPYLSNENTQEMTNQYYHSTKAFCENVLWPDLTQILNATGDKFTGMLAPKLEYSNSEEEILANSIDYYFRQNEKISGEIGLSGDQMESQSFYQEKLSLDSDTLKELLPNYTFNVFAPGKMPESVYKDYVGNKEKSSVLSSIKTIVLPKETEESSIFSFYNENIISMTNTIDGFSHTDEEDLYMRSIQTALGYSSVYLDFTQVLYPTSIQDDWTKLSQNFSRYLTTHWEVYRKVFDQITVSDTDLKARRFLALSYNSYRQNDIITLSISNFQGKASFILHLSNERITSVSDGNFAEIETNKYVITANAKDIVIHVTANDAE